MKLITSYIVLLYRRNFSVKITIRVTFFKLNQKMNKKEKTIVIKLEMVRKKC